MAAGAKEFSLGSLFAREGGSKAKARSNTYREVRLADLTTFEVCGKKSFSRKYDCCIEFLTKSLTNGAKPERIKRSCLKCGGTFSAIGRFNRICPMCQEKDTEIYFVSY